MKMIFCIQNIIGYISEKINHMYSYRIIMIHTITLALASLIFFPLLPILLNYPPYIFEHQNVYVMIYGVSYAQAYFTLSMGVVISYFILLKIMLNGIDEWDKSVNNESNNNFLKINKIRKKCLYTPYYIFVFEIITPVILLGLLELFYYIFYTPPFIIFVKLSILLFLYITSSATISFILSKKVYTVILLKTYKKHDLGTKISLKTKIFLQVLPIIIIAILFTALIGYSRLIDEKGNLLFKIYKNQLTTIFPEPYKINDIQQFQSDLRKIKFEGHNDFYFLVTPDHQTITSNQSSLSKKFVIFMNHLSAKFDGKVYEETGETQGVVIKIKGLTGDWRVGIQYTVTSHQIMIYFFISFLTLLALAIIVLYYFSKTISDDIKLISSSLTEIAEREDVQFEKKIAVTSNDEIGELVIAFNKIQEREKQYIKQIEENQRVLLEQERLATLGQMIGGIAHNLQSPLRSLTYGLEALNDLAKEYDESIDDDHVTKGDHHEIAKEMIDWFESIKPYCLFMADLITTIREQAVPFNTSIQKSFTLEELVKRIEILLQFELKKNHCIVEKDIRVDLETRISGEINNLVQVCNNLIINAIQAYDGKRGEIKFQVATQENRLLFMIKDNGKGIPSEIQDKLLRQIITTKGKKGTGLGLYMSCLMIKGHFNGDLYFESKENEGSTFYISIPYCCVATM